VVTEPDPNAVPDSVLRTDPVAGTSVNAGSEVKLVLAAGTLKVPSVVNLPRDQAQTTLEDAGFRVRLVFGFSDKPTDTVIKQTPDANTLQPPKTQITLTVSQGASPSPTPPPTTPPASSSAPATSPAQSSPPATSAPPPASSQPVASAPTG
jgi:eukaryotic-like serine/threonine-protein kinase